LEKYLPGSDRILDYGSGTGTLSLIFAGRAKEIHGIDFASGMIEAARRKAAENGIDNVRFMQTTIFDTRLEKGYIEKKE
jgi:23S rRNA (uracil1939-C5)-methyltransferase